VKRPSDHYADYLLLISRLTFVVLAIAFVVLLAGALGLFGDPFDNLIEVWKSGKSPFWMDGLHPVAWAIILPPLIPLIGSLYLFVVFCRFRRYRPAVLALLQGMVLLGASLFFFL
jgi:hypothetical protein